MEELVKKFKKNGTAELLRKVEKLVGDERTACVEVLRQRNQDVSKWLPEQDVEEKEEPFVTQDVEVDVEEVSERSTEKEEIPAIDESESKEFKKGDKVKFISAKNSKKAPNQMLDGEVKSIKEDNGKKWLVIKVENLGMFLKEASKCS